MTAPDTNSLVSDELIDRLVDGALGAAELRQAIARLDQSPDGWKRCAIAFLEAQCWREAMLAYGAPGVPRTEREARNLPLATVSARRPLLRWTRGLAAAATVAIAYALGSLSHKTRPDLPAGRTSPGPAGAVLAEQAHGPPAERVTVVADESPRPTRPVSQPRALQSPPNPIELVQMVARLRIGPEGTSAVVPILAGPGIDSNWLQNQPPPISEYRQAVLQRHGYQVDQRRRLLVTTLADGRRVTVPIDEVQIRYTSNKPL